MKGLPLLTLTAVVACAGCEHQSTLTTTTGPLNDQELSLTFGGFLSDGPEDQTVDGVCKLDAGRTVLDCDIHNGLPSWALTEITTVVVWFPYHNENKQFYRTPVSIEPLTASHITIRLGVVLPSDDVVGAGISAQPTHKWKWRTVGARGRPAK
jgi:hypothetical protein